METDKIFYLKWKGGESGPFSETELGEMRASGKIGMLHLVSANRISWVPFKDFDASEAAASAAEENVVKRVATDRFALALYALSGTAFLSPFIFLASAVLSIYAWHTGEKRLAVLSLALSAAIAAAGWAFFSMVIPALSR